MINKSIVALSLIMAMPTMAGQCDFKSINGIEFELGKTSQYQKFLNGQKRVDANSYELIFSRELERDKFGNQFWQEAPLSYADAYGRNLKITNPTEFRYEYVVDKTDPTVKNKVRKYEAILDNCRKVIIKVPETRHRFEKYFNLFDESIDGKFSFKAEQADLGLIYLNDIKKIESYVGKNIYFLNTIVDDFYGISNDQFGKVVKLDTLKPYKVESVVYDYISIPGGTVGQYRDGQFGVIVKVEGKEVKVPFIRERFAYSNPLYWKSIRSEYRDEINRREVVYGMNMHEVTLAMGIPKYIRHFEVVKSVTTQAEYERNDYFPYGGKSFNHPLGATYPAGVREAWFYDDADGYNRHIIFSRKGELIKIQQTDKTIDYVGQKGYMINIEK